MSVQSDIVILSNDDMSLIKVDTASPQESVESLVKYLEKIVAGCGSGSVNMKISRVGGAAASGTITLSSFVAMDTLTVGTQVFTSAAVPSGDNQFLSTGGDTVVAAAAAAKISAHPALQEVVSASSALGVITVVAAQYGAIGNMVDLAISAHGSVSGAQLAGGVNSTSHVMHCGL